MREPVSAVTLGGSVAPTRSVGNGAITSNLDLAEAPGNVRVRPPDSGLPKPSVVNVSQLLTIHRDYLAEKMGTLPAKVMNQVAEGLRLVLAL